MHAARILGWLGFALQVTLLAIIIVSLTEWWGILWVLVLLLPPIVFLGIYPIGCRFLRGTWPKFATLTFGSLGGCAGFIVLFPVLLVYPIAHKVIEGAWPTVYLGLWVAHIVLELTNEFYVRRKNL